MVSPSSQVDGSGVESISDGVRSYAQAFRLSSDLKNSEVTDTASLPILNLAPSRIDG